MANLSDSNYNYSQGSNTLIESGSPKKTHKSDRPTLSNVITNDIAKTSPQSALEILVNSNPGNISPRAIRASTVDHLTKSSSHHPLQCGKQIVSSDNWQQLGLKDFIIKYNDSRGNLEMKEWAFEKLSELEQRGGVGPKVSLKDLDIPAARLGLIDLTGIANQKIKFRALRSLQEILKKYPITKEYYEGLLEAMSTLHEKMQADFQQHQLVELQIEFAKTYGAMAELILRHYAANLCNGITEDLKYKFKAAIDSLKMLNRQDDPCLSYYAKFALEGIIRLKDDREEIKGVFGAIYHFALAGSAVYFEDGQLLAQELPKILSDIKINIKHSWYEKSIRIREMGNYALTDLKTLENLLKAIEDNRKMGWNFLYTGVETLSNIAIHGATKQIRKTALRGCVLEDKYNTRLPGLLAYTNYTKIKLPKMKIQSRLSLRKPKIKDPNAFVRLACLKNLIKIAAEAPDATVRMNARNSIIHSLNFESAPLIKNYHRLLHSEKLIPINPESFHDWINEKGQFANQPLTIKGVASSHSDFDLNSATEFTFESASNSQEVKTKKSTLTSRKSLSALDVTPEFASDVRKKRRSLQAPIQNHRLTKSDQGKLNNNNNTNNNNNNSEIQLIKKIAESSFDSLLDLSVETPSVHQYKPELGSLPDSSNEISGKAAKLELKKSIKNLGKTT